jgi:hypothetical protein
MAEETYNRIKPLIGKRKALDIRPIGERYRHWERVSKVSDIEYYITNQGRWNPNQIDARAMTFKIIDGYIEHLVIHIPHWLDGQGNRRNSTRPLSSSSDYYFYDYHLPRGLNMVNHRGRKYVKCDGQHYTLMEGDITFQRVGNAEWKPLVVHREVIHHIDRAKKKVVAEKVKPLMDYLNVMIDMVDTNYHWGITMDSEVWKHLENYNGEPHEKWVTLAERYKQKIRNIERNNKGDIVETFNKADLIGYVISDATRASKPFKQVEVPLGQLCYDRYRSIVKGY